MTQDNKPAKDIAEAWDRAKRGQLGDIFRTPVPFDRDHAREIFREHVLAALDKATAEAFGPYAAARHAGAIDGDLPRLFKAIDDQLAVIADRFRIELT